MVLCIHHGELHQPLCNENCTDARSQAKTDSKTDANPNAQTSMLYREEKRLEVPFHGPKIPPIIKINTIITIFSILKNFFFGTQISKILTPTATPMSVAVGAGFTIPNGTVGMQVSQVKASCCFRRVGTDKRELRSKKT